jgi:hypothetical protein
MELAILRSQGFAENQSPGPARAVDVARLLHGPLAVRVSHQDRTLVGQSGTRLERLGRSVAKTKWVED